MAAAAAGKSTLGIPKSVGKEFMQADILKKKYGNYTDSNGTHHTHWKKGRKYGGSNVGGGSIGSGAAGGGG